jgi:hypothetical protein
MRIIQEANNKNQAFQNAAQSLDFFLVNLPNNNILASDESAQINSKHNSQKVTSLTDPGYHRMFPNSIMVFWYPPL